MIAWQSYSEIITRCVSAAYLSGARARRGGARPPCGATLATTALRVVDYYCLSRVAQLTYRTEFTVSELLFNHFMLLVHYVLMIFVSFNLMIDAVITSKGFLGFQCAANNFHKAARGLEVGD